MQKMNIFKVLDNYNTGHFGNEAVEVGNRCWILMQDDEGLHEYPVLVREPSTREVEHELKFLNRDIEERVVFEKDVGRAEFEAFELKKRIDLVQKFGGNSEQIKKAQKYFISDKTEIKLSGYEFLEKTVKPQGNGAMVLVPKAWVGKRVKVVLVEPL